MDAHRVRNARPVFYAVAIVTAFAFAGGTIGSVVIMAGAMLLGIGYATLSGGGGLGRVRGERREARDRRRGSAGP